MLNIGFLICEYFDLKYKDKKYPLVRYSGIGSAEVKKITTLLIGVVGLYASILTIRNEHVTKHKLENMENELNNANKKLAKAQNETIITRIEYDTKINNLKMKINSL